MMWVPPQVNLNSIIVADPLDFTDQTLLEVVEVLLREGALLEEATVLLSYNFEQHLLSSVLGGVALA